VIIFCTLSCLFPFWYYLCLSAGPDLRGDRGAALVNWGGGGATESGVK
jgi:hypothetical protein